MKATMAIATALVAAIPVGGAPAAGQPSVASPVAPFETSASAYTLTAQIPPTLRKGEVATLTLRVQKDGRPVDHVAACLATAPLFVSVEDAMDPTPAGGIDLGTDPETAAAPACTKAMAGVGSGPGTYTFTWEPDTAGRVNLTFSAGESALTAPVDVASAPPSAGILIVFVLIVAAVLGTAAYSRVSPRRGAADRGHLSADATGCAAPASGFEPNWMTIAMRSRYYPAAFQWITAAAFVVIALSVLFGVNNSGQNFGMAMIWSVWWPLLPLSFFLVGRFWCAICPLAWLSDRVQKAVGLQLQRPAFLRRHGLWVVAALFVLVTYVDETRRLSGDARETGYLLLALLAAAVVFGAFLERRTFCRDVCFVGGLAATYSRAGVMRLRAALDRCHDCRAQGCYDGTARAPGCPVFLFAPSPDDGAMCHLCGNCVKNCPREAIGVSVRRPLTELWHIDEPRLPDAVLVAIIVGLVLLEQAVLLPQWIPLLQATGRLLQVDPYVRYSLVNGVLMAAFVAVPLVGLGLAGVLSETLAGTVGRAGVLRNVVGFGYALIPIALASHVANGLFRVLTQSRAVPYALLAMAGRFPQSIQAGWLPNSILYPIEMAVLTLGVAGSLYVGYRIACQRWPRAPWAACLPHVVLLLGVFAANVYAVRTMLQVTG